jgi:hypothetical protein
MALDREHGYQTLQRKNLTNILYGWPLGSHVWQPSMKSLLSWNWVSAPRMKSWPPAIVRPGRQPGLPHSPSNEPHWNREGQFNKVVTRLLSLLGPIKPDMWPVQVKACHQGQNDVVHNWHRQGLPPWNLGIATSLSPSFPSECSTSP